MRITITVLLVLSCAMSLDAAVHHSSELGWREGQDVTLAFAAMLKDGTLKPGDELVLDHAYKISGNHVLPDNFTVSAAKDAGFEVTDAVEPANNQPLLELGNKNTLRNCTITYLNTPELGPTGEKRGETFTTRLGIQARDRSNIRIENCRLTGSIGHHLRLEGCSSVKVIGCHIAGGHWSVYVVETDELDFERCLIEKCQGDAIKTGGNGPQAVQRVRVLNCVFQDNLRDGIDSTGGLNDSIVRNSIFRRMGVSGIDIKSHYESRTGTIEDVGPENIGIVIENCLFHDMPNGIVLTTIDGGRRKGPGNELLTPDNVKAYAPHDIEVNDCIFGHAERPLRPKHEGGYGVNYPSDDDEHTRMFHLKDAYDIRYRNLRLFGERIKVVYVNSIGGSRHLSQEAAEVLDHSITGNVLDEPAPQAKPGITAIPFECGPQPLELSKRTDALWLTFRKSRPALMQEPADIRTPSPVPDGCLPFP